jgi:hypothetical protein
MLKAALMNKEVERGKALDDSDARQVVNSLVKQRRDSIEQFVNGGRQDLADKEAAEIRVLESYPWRAICRRRRTRPRSIEPSRRPWWRPARRHRKTWAK